MIYTTLRKIPMITMVEIIDSGDLTLLTDEEKPIEELIPIWETLYNEYQEKYNSQNSNKVFSLVKEIEFLETKYIIIQKAVEALKFDSHHEIIEMLQDYGYTFRKENYFEDLERVYRESEGIITKIKQIQKSLPKVPEGEIKSDNAGAIVRLMAAYSSILGYDFDFYSISVEKFYSIENQAKQKIAALEKQNSKKK